MSTNCPCNLITSLDSALCSMGKINDSVWKDYTISLLPLLAFYRSFSDPEFHLYTTHPIQYHPISSTIIFRIIFSILQMILDDIVWYCMSGSSNSGHPYHPIVVYDHPSHLGNPSPISSLQNPVSFLYTDKCKGIPLMLYISHLFLPFSS